MRSTICVPMLLRSTMCVLFQNPNVLDPRTNQNTSGPICIGSSYKLKIVSEDEQVNANLYWIHVHIKILKNHLYWNHVQTDQTTLLRTNHFSNHLYWIYVHNQLVSFCTPWTLHSDYFPSTFRLRSVYVPSTFRPHAFAAMHISPSAFECVRSTTCVP